MINCDRNGIVQTYTVHVHVPVLFRVAFLWLRSRNQMYLTHHSLDRSNTSRVDQLRNVNNRIGMRRAMTDDIMQSSGVRLLD